MILIDAPLPKDTKKVGRVLAHLLEAGDIVRLSGPLGSGKTLLVGGIGEGLGVKGPVTSPSFVLVRHYRDGTLPLWHADVYRLGSSGEWEDLDLVEEARAGALVIEWGEVLGDRLSEMGLLISIEGTGDEPRTIRLFPSEPWLDRQLEQVLHLAVGDKP